MNFEYMQLESEVTQPLSKSELMQLFKLSKEGSMEAREKIILHNIRLVTYEISRRFINFDYDKSDLFSIGILGLINAVDNYDFTKDYEFSTFAIRCIDNEILMFIRELQKEIADMFNVKPAAISKVIIRVLRNIEKLLIDKDIIEMPSEQLKSRKRTHFK